MDKQENKEVDINHYKNTSNKIIDFIIGFFGSYIAYVFLGFIITLLLHLFYNLFPYSFGEYSIISTFLFVITIIIISISTIWFAFKAKRRFIAFGIITAISMPLLAFGACFTIFGAFSYF